MNCQIQPLRYTNFLMHSFNKYTVGPKKKIIPINFNTNSRREMKLIRNNMDYCLLEFNALKFFLGVHLHGGSLPNLNFFYVNLQI